MARPLTRKQKRDLAQRRGVPEGESDAFVIDRQLHQFIIEADPGLTSFGTRWRWTCSCGKRGRWSGQSESVPWYAWRRNHIGKLLAPDIHRHAEADFKANFVCEDF